MIKEEYWDPFPYDTDLTPRSNQIIKTQSCIQCSNELSSINLYLSCYPINDIKNDICGGNRMKKYRKKSIVVEAVQFDPKKEWPKCIVPWKNSGYSQPRDTSWGFIDTLEGRMHVLNGDWIIKGINGEFYPCRPDIFEKTYELVK
jgi:hypothetical protein